MEELKELMETYNRTVELVNEAQKLINKQSIIINLLQDEAKANLETITKLENHAKANGYSKSDFIN